MSRFCTTSGVPTTSSHERNVWRELCVRPSGEILVIYAHCGADPARDPERNPEWKIRDRKKYTSQPAWEREQEIVDEAGGGERGFADTP